ncbi:MAG: type II secretion system protein [Candidatus Omnitrophica bacterium]|nr:type II secretion system protein [Candidatus Omnitrophota bacterium]
MNKKSGFNLIEIAITMAIVGILATLSFYGYKHTVDKTIKTNALLTLNAIRQAEQTRKIDNKSFIAANNTSEINQILELKVQPKYYEYRVINVTDDDFLVIAERIGSDIDSQDGLSNRIVIVMNGGGELQPGSLTPGGNGGGGLIVTGGSNPGSTGGGNIPGVPGVGVNVGSGGSSGGGSTGGGSGGLATRDSGIAANLAIAFELLKGVNDEAYNLIIDKNISIIFDDFSKYPGTANALAFWWGTAHNTIYVNQSLQAGTSNQAIAALISHEATHADYDYNSQEWIDYTLAQHSELTAADLSIPDNSIDQEYNCFGKQVAVWNELKDARGDANNDAWAAYYAQGEAAMKAQIRSVYSDQALPEY